MTFMTTSTTPSTPVEVSHPPSLAEFIVHTPDTCGGKARIAGTRITVKLVYISVERAGMTPAQVVDDYPHLTMAQVHAALAYYWSHQDEIHRDIENEDRLIERMKAEAGPSRLQERLAQLDATDDPLPPR